MTKKELANVIAEETKLTQIVVKDIIHRLFDGIIDTLEKERRIELRDFGVFEVKQRKAMKARNPRTGEEIMVPAKLVVTFKPGMNMQERVNVSNDGQWTRHGANGRQSIFLTYRWQHVTVKK